MLFPERHRRSRRSVKRKIEDRRSSERTAMFLADKSRLLHCQERGNRTDVRKTCSSRASPWSDTRNFSLRARTNNDEVTRKICASTSSCYLASLVRGKKKRKIKRKVYFTSITLNSRCFAVILCGHRREYARGAKLIYLELS